MADLFKITDLCVGHTAGWKDGLKVTRMFVYERKKKPPEISLHIVWNGIANHIRLGTRTHKIWREPKKRRQ